MKESLTKELVVAALYSLLCKINLALANVRNLTEEEEQIIEDICNLEVDHTLTRRDAIDFNWFEKERNRH